MELESVVRAMATMLLETRSDLDDIIGTLRLTFIVNTDSELLDQLETTTAKYFKLAKETRGSPHIHRFLTAIRVLADDSIINKTEKTRM